MKIKKEHARNIIHGYHDHWETIEEKVIDQDRWTVNYEGVFKHIPTGNFYLTYWSVGYDEPPENYILSDEVEFTEVQQVEKLIKVWEIV